MLVFKNKIQTPTASTSSACKVYKVWKPAVQKHTAAQKELCKSFALHFTTYSKLLYLLNHTVLIQLYLFINLKTLEWKTSIPPFAAIACKISGLKSDHI